MASISFEQVNKFYDNGMNAVSNLDMEIRDGEFLVLVGPSGCGKSTILRMIAGLEDISSGTLKIGDRVVNDLEPKDRDIAMVFQSYALYPHMTVRENIGFPLRLAKLPQSEIDAQVREAARILELADQLDKRPGQLSGGQRQRVAMGRAIVRHPSVFLLDEPLSNLDAKLRTQTRMEIVDLQARLGVTTVYVTHDQVEAMTMGHRVAVMKDGVLQQIGEPRKLYAEPANIFVAGFIGLPGMNLLRTSSTGTDLDFEGMTLPLKDTTRSLIRSMPSRDFTIGVRPEHVVIGSEGVPGEVGGVEELGPEVIVRIQLRLEHQPATVLARTDGTAGFRKGDEVRVSFRDKVHVFDSDGQRLAA